MQRERDAREARQLDREIRAQERHYQSESKKHKDAVDKASSAAISTQVHTQLRQGNRGSNNDRKTSTTTPPSRSPRNSVERTTLLAEHTLASDPFLQLSSPSGPLLSEDSTLKSFEAVSDCFQTIGIVFSCKFFYFSGNPQHANLTKIAQRNAVRLVGLVQATLRPVGSFAGELAHHSPGLARASHVQRNNGGGRIDADNLRCCGLGHSCSHSATRCDHVARWLYRKRAVANRFAGTIRGTTSVYVSLY